jgi:hypothetical protein
MSLQSTLVASLELNEASGNALDSTSNLNDLTDNNSVGSVSGGSVLHINGVARDFNGTTQYFSSSDTDFETSQSVGSFMFEVWFYPDSVTGHHTILSKQSGTDPEYKVELVEAGTGGTAGDYIHFIIWENTGGTPVVATIPEHIETGAWYCLVVYYLASQAQMLMRLTAYSNASLIYTIPNAVTGGPQTGSAEFRVGGTNVSGSLYPFDGKIGPLRFWNGSLPDVVGTDHLLTTIYWLSVGSGTWGSPGTYGRVYSELATTPTVTFVGEDTTTQGSWIGVYGADGYYFPNGYTDSPPAYGELTYFRAAGASGTAGMQTAATFEWTAFETDPKGIQNPADPTGNRSSSTWYNGSGCEFMFDAGTTTRRISIYYLDYDVARTGMQVQVYDMLTGATLDGPRSMGTIGTGALSKAVRTPSSRWSRSTLLQPHLPFQYLDITILIKV